MELLQEGFKFSGVANEQLNAYCRVKVLSTGKWAYADATDGDQWEAITLQYCAADDVVALVSRNAPCYYVRAAGAFSLADDLYPADDGEVDDDGLGPSCGLRAVEAAAAAHDEVLCRPTGKRPLLGATTVAADALAIPITHEFVNKATGADAEALTLANGWPGLEFTLECGTHGGGDGTLTPTTSVFTTIVFDAAGEWARLKYLNDTDGWYCVGSNATVSYA